MRAIVRNVLTKEEAEILSSMQLEKQDFDNNIVSKIVFAIEPIIGKRNYNSPSYLVLDSSEKGHDWHKDTGTNGHMKWCNYGISVLLRKSKKGLFKYKSPKKFYSQDEHFLNALIHSSNEWHKREDSIKGRTVLLMFLS